MVITSVQNPLIKKTLALKEAKARRDLGRTLIDGKRELDRAIKAKVEIEQIFYCSKMLPSFHSNNYPGIECVEVNEHVLEKLSFGQRCEGIVAVASPKSRDLKDLKLDKNPLVVILESVEKPGNLGAVLRTCDGAGVCAVIICAPSTDLYNPNVIRASTGTVFSLPVVCASPEDVVTFAASKNITLVGTFPQASLVYTQARLTGGIGIVLGKEDEGLSSFWNHACSLKVRIPMKGHADSLNVSVCAALLIYEALRQRS